MSRSYSPIDIHQREFSRSIRGYSVREVREFLEELSNQMEAMVVEHKKANDTIEQLEDRLREFREREKTLRDTLVTAQKMSESIRASAQNEHDSIISAAELQAQRIIADAQMRAHELTTEIVELKQQKVKLAASLHATLKLHYETLRASMKELPEAPSAHTEN